MMNFKTLLIIPVLVGGVLLVGCSVTGNVEPAPTGPSMTDEQPNVKETPNVTIFGEVDVDYAALEGDPWVFVDDIDGNGLTVVQGEFPNADQATVNKTVEWFNDQFGEWGDLVTSVNGKETLHGVTLPSTGNNAQLQVVAIAPGVYDMFVTVTATTELPE